MVEVETVAERLRAEETRGSTLDALEALPAGSIPRELALVVAQHAGPLSIGGGRYSMGGQIATDGTLFIDMRQMNQVLELNTEEKWVRVQAGATWRDIQQARAFPFLHDRASADALTTRFNRGRYATMGLYGLGAVSLSAGAVWTVRF